MLKVDVFFEIDGRWQISKIDLGDCSGEGGAGRRSDFRCASRSRRSIAGIEAGVGKS